MPCCQRWRVERRIYGGDYAGKNAFDRVAFDPQMMGGRACIRGMRITVGLIVELIAQGASVEEPLDDYPDLEAEDIRQALAYAAWLAREEPVI